MKIAFLNMYSGTVDRGAETFIHEVAQRLSKNHKVTLFQDGPIRGRENYKVERINVGIDWKRKDTSETIWAKLFINYLHRKLAIFTLRVIPLIWKEKFDLVVPVNGGWQPAFVRIVTWIYRGKMVISGQSGVGWDDRNNLWSFPNAFVALSRKAEKWANKANPFIKTRYIPNGVDLNIFKPGGAKLKIDLKSPIVLCVGALTPSKRIDLVIKAVSRIENVSLLVVGDGDLKDKIAKLGKDLLGKRFLLLKFPFEEMPKVYGACDLFTIVSEPYYAFEIVLVEAMASGLGVVANKDEIRRDIVGEGGVLVDPTDIKSYTQTIKKALKTNWKDKPRKQAEKFSWDKIAVKHEKLFKEVVG